MAKKELGEAPNPVVEAINDLTRVTIALHGDFVSKAEAVRRLSELSIPAGRIAAILAMDVSHVHTYLARAKKAAAKTAEAKSVKLPADENG
jgi:hypothetical protein